MNKGGAIRAQALFGIPLFLLLLAPLLRAETRQVDPSWLHRYVPALKDSQIDVSSSNCHYKSIFGEGDAANRTLINVTRFGEATVDANGKCQSVQYDRQEELYFVLSGS